MILRICNTFSYTFYTFLININISNLTRKQLLHLISSEVYKNFDKVDI